MDLVDVSETFPPHPGPPLGRGRIARRAFANPERLDSSQRGTRRSLSLRERARVRGNETQATKTAGRILQAQLHRFLDSDFRFARRLLISLARLWLVSRASL